MNHVKDHLKKHKEAYLVGGLFVLAGITYAIVRRDSSQPIEGGISVLAKGGISVLGKKVEMNNVSYISQNRSGPPSWVVRCLDTGAIFQSQKSAAKAAGIDPSELSKHLNGFMDDVRGLHFERICMAA